jgi:ferric-dicitrate binding protein FerR (iron transport regulator)
VYATGIGETRWISLADGTTIELNAQSRIRVRLTRREREVDLLQGQALFKVSRNPARPFVVHSGPAQITDLGTEFDVYRRHTDTVVTVIEGRVAVRSGLAPNPVTSLPPPQVITAGEQADLMPQASPRPIHADVAVATAWTRQQLVFSSAPLSEVVEQYNLYHVSGEFSATDSAALVAFLRAQPLGVALAEFARTRDLQLIYHSEVVGDRRTKGAVGDFTPEQELEQLLRGTGLTYRYLSDMAVTIVPIASSGGAAQSRRPAGIDRSADVGDPRYGAQSRLVRPESSS